MISLTSVAPSCERSSRTAACWGAFFSVLPTQRLFDRNIERGHGDCLSPERRIPSLNIPAGSALGRVVNRAESICSSKRSFIAPPSAQGGVETRYSLQRSRSSSGNTDRTRPSHLLLPFEWNGHADAGNDAVVQRVRYFVIIGLIDVICLTATDFAALFA